MFKFDTKEIVTLCIAFFNLGFATRHILSKLLDWLDNDDKEEKDR